MKRHIFLILYLFCVTSARGNDLDICKEKICIRKCCSNPNEYFVNKRNCRAYDKRPLNFSEVNIHHVIPNEVPQKTNKSFGDTFHLIPGLMKNATFRIVSFIHAVQFIAYLAETGELVLEHPNTYQRWTVLRDDSFCIDYRLFNNSEPKVVFFVALPEVFTPDDGVLIISGLLVSCFFLLLVLIVYALLPELRNLGGLVLMAYVAMLLGGFLLMATFQLDRYDLDICVNLTIATYFLLLSSFCWMNVMSYDIWWTFRGYAKARPIHRRGETFKFCMYCLYAWGLPLGLTLMMAVINSMKLKDKPWFIQPQVPALGCFLMGGQKLLYLYTPMLIMIMFNWLFFLMTAYNVWRLSRGTAVLDSPAAGTRAAHRTHRNRLMVYLKLSIIMGVNWVLEVVSFLVPNSKFWIITDSYNVLLGLMIFLIFVCKKKIFRKLVKKYHGYRESKWFSQSKSRSSSTTDSHVSQTVPLQVCPNPKGPVYE